MSFFKRTANNFRFLYEAIRILRKVEATRKNPDRTFIHIIREHAKARPDSIAMIFEDREISYREYDRLSDAYAHWARQQGVKKGSVVALLMENRPEFLIAWLGIIKAGGTAALINTNLMQKSLAHCLDVSDAKHLVLGAEMADNYATATEFLKNPIRPWATGGKIQGMDNLDDALASQPDAPFLPDPSQTPSAEDNALYIYTSGTTGNPKAAKISHFRMLLMMNGFSLGTHATHEDRLYLVLPLYHSAGGVVLVGTAFMQGGTLVIRRKFSATAFWDDIHKYKITIFQYIGELCRYLLNAPEHPKEKDHSLRVVFGNGLRPDIWEDFQKRFKIPKILEFYGATEGNLSLINYDGKPGSVGRLPKIFKKLSHIELVRFDVEKEEPVRGEDGHCIPCEPDEVGEAIGKIMTEPEKKMTRFEGYVGEKETKKKILRDVLEKGDEWFRTGDLLKYDRYGYFYFIDRIGDTFRWKGENVATSEVSEVLSVFPGIGEANVYGVPVPGTDGRAGMAALVKKGEIDLPKLGSYLKDALPLYALPLFLRIQPEIEITGTFKHRKGDLVKEGYDPKTITDAIYFFHPEQKAYVPLDEGLYQTILEEKIKI